MLRHIRLASLSSVLEKRAGTDGACVGGSAARKGGGYLEAVKRRIGLAVRILRMTMKRNLRVFISHSHRDGEAAARFAEAMGNEGFEPWLASEIQPGANWAEEIAEALNRSQAIVILISPEFMNSEWAKWEIDFALSGERFNHRVIPVLLKPTSQFPWILNRLKVIRATHNIDKAARQVVNALRQSTEVPTP